MRIVLLLLTLLCSLSSQAAPVVATVVDYLRETPASVSGEISMDKSMSLYNGKWKFLDVGMRVNANKGIGYSFSEKHLSINTNGGISLTISGIPVKVKTISYHEQTGKFEVHTDTPMGIGEKTINEQVEAKLNEMYKPKMIKAFKELKSIRAKDNLHDIGQVSASITKIFTEGKESAEIPTIRGSMNLEFFPQKDTNLRLDSWTAKLKKDDSISTGVEFVRRGSQITVTGVNFRSQKGIRVHGKTDYPEIASLNFQGFDAGSHGIKFYYDIGAEEVLTGFKMLMNVVGAYNGHPENVYKECDPVKLEKIRQSIDGNLKVEIAKMIRTHRRTLIAGGISAELLAALD
jgi:hypothetical protein